MRRIDEIVELLRIGDGIVEVLDHDILEGAAPPAGILVVLDDGRNELLQRICLVDRHQSVPSLVVRGMEGYRQVDLEPLLSEAEDSWDDAAGGDGDVPGADIQAERRIDVADEGEDVVIVVEGFSRPHHDDVAHPQVLVLFLQIAVIGEDLSGASPRR